jgi:bifunctional non-homologous end joining protein LigD
MAADEPKRFVAMASKAKRQGKVFLDYLRNGRGATAIASYSLRARPGFPVAAPVFWEELRTLPGADAFDRISVLQRLQQLTADPWEDLQGSASIITQKMRRSVGMAA